jgi:phenylacetic acid degradation operon negative regulatory protein
MKKLLKPKDILLLVLAGMGDLAEEARDPLQLMSSAYENMYGFVPRRYTRNNFFQMVGRSLKTGEIERVVKDGKVYLRLTSAGQNKVKRDFSIANLTKKWNKRWVVLVFDIKEKSRRARDILRNKLRNIGFGMLQESVWITPLPIGKDVWEFIDTIGLSENVFVMEVSHLIFGNPRELAYKVWHLDQFEEKYIEIKREIENINQLLARYHDRDKQRKAKTTLSPLRRNISPHEYTLESKKREFMKRLLEFAISLPPLPQELLPKSFKEEFVRNSITAKQ